MIRSGLVSITFRQLSPREIVALTAEAGLEAIEWGGDVHVPHGDVATARQVRRMTEEAGLAVASYGSYYKVGADAPESFDGVLAAGVALGAAMIRVWAGDKGSGDADQADRARVAAESRRIAALAAGAGIEIAYEWHGGSLTDTTESAVALLAAVGREDVGAYWQPAPYSDVDACLASIQAVAPHLRNVHVYAWDGPERLPLSAGAARWRQYLAAIAGLGGERFAMLEFVRDDDPAALREDAATLRGWLAEL